MVRKLQGLAAITALLASVGLSGPAEAELDVGGQITLTSDYTFRGVSQTMSNPAVQVELDVDHDSGWYGYIWASNVHFTDSNTPDDGARAEVDFVIGYAHSIDQNVSLGVDVSAYTFPGTKSGFNYDYVELHTTLTANDQYRLTIGYSDNVFNSGSSGIFYSAGSDFALSERLSLGLELAHYDLDDGHDMAYSYGMLSLAGELTSFDWQLSFLTTSSEAEEIFYASNVDDRLILSLTMPF